MSTNDYAVRVAMVLFPSCVILVSTVTVDVFETTCKNQKAPFVSRSCNLQDLILFLLVITVEALYDMKM